jgi:hypothetical protein
VEVPVGVDLASRPIIIVKPNRASRSKRAVALGQGKFRDKATNRNIILKGKAECCSLRKTPKKPVLERV